MTKHLTIEEARQRYVGRSIHGKEVVDVVDGYTNCSGKQGWTLKVICPFCGSLFEKKMATLKSYPKAHCGCLNKQTGEAWRGKMLTPAKQPKPERKKSTTRWYSEDAVSQFTKDQLYVIWVTLPKEKLCIAWQDFEKFYQWSIRNGYTRDRNLCHVDTSKPMSPLTCKWVVEK